MDEIFKEISQIEASDYDLYKIKALNETLEHYAKDLEASQDNHLEHITKIFNNKLKSNPNFNKVVDDYVKKYAKDDLRDQAREDLYFILTGEMLGLFKGLNNTKCTIM